MADTFLCNAFMTSNSTCWFCFSYVLQCCALWVRPISYSMECSDWAMISPRECAPEWHGLTKHWPWLTWHWPWQKDIDQLLTVFSIHIAPPHWGSQIMRWVCMDSAGWTLDCLIVAAKALHLTLGWPFQCVLSIEQPNWLASNMTAWLQGHFSH